MIKINSKAFGEIEIEEKQIIQFPFGIPGFDDLKEFALLDSGQYPFYWLQSTKQVEVAFILMDPFLLKADYQLEVPDNEFESIQLTGEKGSALIFTILTVRANGAMITANLQAPVVINPANKKGRQFISTNPDLSIRFDVLKALNAEEAK